jgi:glycosyltransferase involved in cell wall biosynthesis
MPAKPIILVICDFYLPGFESGGAARTLANMIDRLGDRYDFRVVTRDRDGVAATQPYNSVKIGDWNQVGKASVYYLPPGEIRIGKLKELISRTAPAAIYLNSFFSPLTIMSLILERIKAIPPVALIVAPEGEFSAGALALRRFKKLPYLRLARTALLTPKIIWKAASEAERADILDRVGAAEVQVAPNMPPRIIFPEFDVSQRPTKTPGSCRMIFLSRFMRKKNFNWLLPLLPRVEGEIEIDICGTLEEADYWAECRRLTAAFPDRIRVRAIGPVPHSEVQRKLAEYDFFILPTLGENFGHVFVEAFASGVPVIASDRMPWRNLQTLGIGWDIPLDRPNDWVTAIRTAVSMTQAEHCEMIRKTREFAVTWLADPEIERSNVTVLEAALARNS